MHGTWWSPLPLTACVAFWQRWTRGHHCVTHRPFCQGSLSACSVRWELDGARWSSIAVAKFDLDQTTTRSISISLACSTHAFDVLHQPPPQKTAERLRAAIVCTNHTGARGSPPPLLTKEQREIDPKPTKTQYLARANCNMVMVLEPMTAAVGPGAKFMYLPKGSS